MIKNGPGFIHQQIYNDILAKVQKEQWKAGYKLPPEVTLAQEYNVSRDTLRKALKKLEAEGVLYRKPALGTFVRFNKMNYRLSSMEGFSEIMQHNGTKPSSVLISSELMLEVPPEVQNVLGLDESKKVYKIVRVRYSDDVAMAYETAYIAEEFCPNIYVHFVENFSLFDIYENKYKLNMDFADLELEAELATASVQKVLKLKKGSPVLKMRCIVRLKPHGQPLYYVICHYVGDKYKFSVCLPR